jgi:acetyl esterase
MSARMPLHPELKALLDMVAAEGGQSLESLTTGQNRAPGARFIAMTGQPEQVARVRDMTAPGPAGDIPVRVYTRPARPLPRPGVLPRRRLGDRRP